MVDINSLNSIDEIKSQTYGGANLTDAEKKAFFEHTLVGTDLTKAKQVGVFLLSVKEATTKTAKDAALLTKLESEKTNNSLAFQVVNSYNSLVDSTITKLKSLPDTPGPTETLDELETLLRGYQKNFDEAEKERAAKEKAIEDYIKNTSGKNITELAKAEQKVTEIKSLLTKVKANTAILDNIESRNAKYVDVFKVGNFINTGVTYSGRNIIGSNGILNFTFNFVKLLTNNIDRNEMEKTIKNNSYFSHITNKKDVMDAYERLTAAKWVIDIRSGRVEEATKDKDNNITTKEEYEAQFKASQLEKWDDKGWPNVRLELRDLFFFMKNVFPDTSSKPLSGNPLIDRTKAIV